MHRHDIYAGGSGTQSRCRLPHPTPLLGGELDERVLADAGLHLDGDDTAIDGDEEIDLTSAGPDVRRQQPGTAPNEELEREALSETA